MARQSSERRDAEERPVGGVADSEAIKHDDATEEDSREGVARITADSGSSLWVDVRIDPVEIALPAGIGYTLRAYRPAGELTPTMVDGREDDDPFAHQAGAGTGDEDEVIILDEGFNAAIAEETAGSAEPREAEETEREEEEEGREEEEEEEDTAAEDEEVPVFLSHRGRLLLFHSKESLVDFIRSGQPNDLAQVDTWPELVERLQPDDLVPRKGDSYELDLVVENLRGGHDAWDVELLIAAGEIARDLGYALRLGPLVTALSPGSPLDDLDEALRRTAGGGLGGFLGRRRLRRIGAQQATLGWRTIIGKISAVVYWRD